MTTLVTPRSSNRSAISCSERVIVEYVVTSWTHREPPPDSGTRTQHTNSALPISRAATRAMISSLPRSSLSSGRQVLDVGEHRCH
jgi:hypothetical protein